MCQTYSLMSSGRGVERDADVVFIYGSLLAVQGHLGLRDMGLATMVYNILLIPCYLPHAHTRTHARTHTHTHTHTHTKARTHTHTQSGQFLAFYSPCGYIFYIVQ